MSQASARKMPALPVDAADVSDSVSLARFGRFHRSKLNRSASAGRVLLPTLVCLINFRVQPYESTLPTDNQAAFGDGVKDAAFFLTNSWTLSGTSPVNVSTSSDIRS
jgi:hypothetical protein